MQCLDDREFLIRTAGVTESHDHLDVRCELGRASSPDPYASKLAGERGVQIAGAMPFARRHSWSYVARTWLIDRVIERSVQQGTDMVINLAAGLDSRPYGMRLPTALRWIEIDLPDMLNYKNEVMAAERPVCTRRAFASIECGQTSSQSALFGANRNPVR